MEGGGSTTPFYRGTTTLATNPASAAVFFFSLPFAGPDLLAVVLLPCLLGGI